MKVKTEQQYVFDVFVADASVKILSEDPDCILSEDVPVYYIRLVDLFKAISGNHLPAENELFLYSKCDLYVLESVTTLRRVVNINDYCSHELFVRYDQCFHIMHFWLAQMAEWRKIHGFDVPEYIEQLEQELHDQFDHAALVCYMFRLERACYDISCREQKAIDHAIPDYKRAAEKIASILYKNCVTYDTFKCTKHPLAFLDAMPFANFVYEGFVIFTTHFTEIRRPFWQYKIFLPILNDEIKANDLELTTERYADWHQRNMKLAL